MRAVTWHGRADVRVDTVPDPVIQEPTDVIIEVTSSGICGSDLHLIEVMAPFMTVGDVMGHEPMGIVREVGSEVTEVKPGDRVVVPFNISCGTCWMCNQGLQSQCETTQNREQGSGGRPVRLPVRRVAHGVAGRAVRRHPGRRKRARPGARADR
jgi:threonine dehydrogenase-like Zn-dependent dehydrogenase